MKVGSFLVDTIAPPDPFVREIELLDPAEFLSKAQKPDVALKDEVLSFFLYKDPLVKAAILEVKSYANRKITKLLGRVIYELLVAELEDLDMFENFKEPLLLPIPMTQKSIRERGWNQCELIVDAVNTTSCGKTFKTSSKLLVKIKKTGDQVGKGRKERFENLAQCFSVSNPSAVRGRNVIVLDDITTTGATLQEAKRALLEAGARRVLLVAIAH